MLCDICGKKQATVHLTEIVDEQMTELHLCDECAKEKSVQMEQQFGLADLLAGLSDMGKQVKEEAGPVTVKCLNCGLSYEDFRKVGRLGCSECYNTFKKSLSVLLKKIHGSNQHLGKTPLRLAKPVKTKSTLQELKDKLQRAIQMEEFEEAARIRDKIKELEKNNKETEDAA
ncbi:MAG: UvrB/UvrC motif-containing protein [Candidatus Omnitrophica bacterium]|nr:UvrB/UvrC motif-containing protein [Candidatus Omnitrophota bacterium]HOX53923.1 UvrB/UvrC motif-containing protein [Candidatus Omnitrophota bacterium]